MRGGEVGSAVVGSDTCTEEEVGNMDSEEERTASCLYLCLRGQPFGTGCMVDSIEAASEAYRSYTVDE